MGIPIAAYAFVRASNSAVGDGIGSRAELAIFLGFVAAALLWTHYSGKSAALVGTVVTLVAGLAYVPVVGLIIASVAGGLVSILGVVVGVAYGLVSVPVIGLILGLVVRPSGRDARQVVRNELIFALAMVFAASWGLLLAHAIHRFTTWFAVICVAFSIAALSEGTMGLRYVTLLLCARSKGRRYLPWRLGHFLHWCYGAGLVRIAGLGYQFRHKELQDYLAARH
jgi:hypothetical protein